MLSSDSDLILGFTEGQKQSKDQGGPAWEGWASPFSPATVTFVGIYTELSFTFLLDSYVKRVCFYKHTWAIRLFFQPLLFDGLGNPFAESDFT